jgi:hypothetical protein
MVIGWLLHMAPHVNPATVSKIGAIVLFMVVVLTLPSTNMK